MTALAEVLMFGDQRLVELRIGKSAAVRAGGGRRRGMAGFALAGCRTAVHSGDARRRPYEKRERSRANSTGSTAESSGGWLISATDPASNAATRSGSMSLADDA
jgi:hypothetical protein